MTVTKRKPKRQLRMYEVNVSGQNYDQVENGCRGFVIVEDSRIEGYEIGDLLILQKLTHGQKVGEPMRRTVTGFQKQGPGLMRGFLVLALTKETE